MTPLAITWNLDLYYKPGCTNIHFTVVAVVNQPGYSCFNYNHLGHPRPTSPLILLAQ